MDFKWKNYRIVRLDEHNIVVERTDRAIAQRDYVSAQGVLTRRKGQEYDKTTHLGYFSNLSRALQSVLDDYPTRGNVKTLEDVKDLLVEAREGLLEVFNLTLKWSLKINES